MSWLRRLSRDRSISKGDSTASMPSANRPGSFHTNDQSQGLYKDTQYSSTHNSQDKLLNNNASNSYNNHRASAPSSSHEHHHHHPHNSISQYNSQPTLSNQSQRPPGTSTSDAMTMHTAQGILAAAPDPLTKAFNEAIKPYVDQIETLKNEVEDLTLQLQQLEDERADMHAWIDKRGLRAGNTPFSLSTHPPLAVFPSCIELLFLVVTNESSSLQDVPPSIAAAMNTDPSAAQTLNYHIDRKMTVLNHDLHRLQDSLSSHLPTSTFATTLETLLPSIESLSALPSGPPLAFELIIKLGGNLNSHGGDEGWNNEADRASRAAFYARLDEVMVDIIRQRLEMKGAEDPSWAVFKDVKRLEKTGNFLKQKIGLQQYFPRSVERMQFEVNRQEGKRPDSRHVGSPIRVSP